MVPVPKYRIRIFLFKIYVKLSPVTVSIHCKWVIDWNLFTICDYHRYECQLFHHLWSSSLPPPSARQPWRIREDCRTRTQQRRQSWSLQPGSLSGVWNIWKRSRAHLSPLVSTLRLSDVQGAATVSLELSHFLRFKSLRLVSHCTLPFLRPRRCTWSRCRWCRHSSRRSCPGWSPAGQTPSAKG